MAALSTPAFQSFQDFVSTSATGKLAKMPLIHLTNALSLQRIVATKKLIPSECKHFSALIDDRLGDGKEPIAFFFYGRAAYRPKNKCAVPSAGSYPVALIFNSQSLETKIMRIFPFDTGACFNGIYADWIHRDISVMDFSLGSDIINAARNVEIFYGGNEKYVADKPNGALSIDPFPVEIASYYSMICAQLTASADNRKSSIEIHVKGDVDLTDSNVLALILPEGFKNTPNLSNALFPLKPERRFYKITGGSTVEHEGALIAKTIEFLESGI